MLNTQFKNRGFRAVSSALVLSTLSLIITSTSPIIAQVSFKQNSSIGIVRRPPKIANQVLFDIYLKSVEVFDTDSDKGLNVEVYVVNKYTKPYTTSYKNFSISEKQWNQCVERNGRDVVFVPPKGITQTYYILPKCYNNYLGFSDKNSHFELRDAGSRVGSKTYPASVENIRKPMNDMLKYLNNSTGSNFKYIP
ncbi:hypothetical protein H6G04_33980 [Calothrix membranacea FACHB-236]|nr:hypothetical protein [Calothrix membranacea FACHB-236]